MPATPNILIVTTDQQRIDTLGCYGAGYVRTPTIDRLAAQGVRFDRAYCANPVCNPSRASIFSGLQVSRHGVWNVGINLPSDTVLISHRLAEQGYRTHYVGKTHFNHWWGSAAETVESARDWPQRFPAFHGPYYGFQTVEMSMGHGLWGFQGHYGAWVRDQVGPEQFARYQNAGLQGAHFEGEAFDVDLPLRFHQTFWVADCAIDFLRTRDPAQPFLLALGFADPHHPHMLPRAWTDRVDPAAVPPPDYEPGELDDKPEHFRLTRTGRIDQSIWRGKFEVAGQYKGEDYTRLKADQMQRARAYYYTMVQMIDHALGRVLKQLEESGLARDTLVIFTTDHGELLGDHGLWLKGPYLYEQLLRVPLLLRYPAGLAAGQQIGSLVSHVDLVPTILRLLDLPGAAQLDGVDLMPLLTGQTASVRDAVLIEHVDDPDTLRLKTVVTAARKLTYYAGQEFGELFDLDRDPREKVNRWADPAYAADKAALLRRLADFLEPLDKRAPRPYYV